jgi:holliday junction DNA helicase RuvA
VIGRITGVLLEKQPPQVLVDVQGVAYELDVPMSTFYQLPASGARVSLYTHLVVREDAHLLFGFASEGERRTFRQLLKISGIGTRTALALLSGMTVEELYTAVASQDVARMIKIPGIGRKTAERLVLELRDRLAASTAGSPTPAVASPRADALNALLALGYSEKEASATLARLPADLNTSDAIRQALRALSKVL